jgi:hydroxysqualene dehydroxylase
MHVLVIGAGWAGLACAIEATRLGHQVTVHEASRSLGGRARALPVTLPDGTATTLDNGQHILIGAYSQTLQLMRDIGVDLTRTLHRLPLTLRYPDGNGLTLPDWRKPWFAGLDVAAGIFQAKGWSLGDKLSLLRAADAWRRSGFSCPAHYSVTQLCQGVSPRVMVDMIDPLVVSALNISADQASASIFLTVMRDALFAPGSGEVAGSNMLLPTCDLGAIFPTTAADWLLAHGAQIHFGERATKLNSLSNSAQKDAAFNTAQTNSSEKFDATVIAAPAWEAARLAASLGSASADAWAATAGALQHTAITTVYGYSSGAAFSSPVLALRSDAQQPAQFVFDRGALSGQRGVLAFVVSASEGDAAHIERLVIAQGKAQLGLNDLQAIQTITEKRATFACTPNVQRPPMQISTNVFACGDYVKGPYPATLEGAVRSGLAAARGLFASR